MYKISTLLVILITCTFFSINPGICSDNMIAPETQEISSNEPVSSTIVKTKETAPNIEEKLKQYEDSIVEKTNELEIINEPEPAVPSESGSLFDLSKIIKGLLMVVGLIFVLVMGIVFYRKIKARNTGSKGLATVQNKEPENISEAVSSFVKHKLKNN